MTPKQIRHRASAALVLACAALAAATPGGASSADSILDRAQVGVGGRNATHGYSPQLYVDFRSPEGYDRRSCCLDGDGGAWGGPRYQSSNKASLSGDSTIGWGATFETKSRTNAEAVHSFMIQDGWAETAPFALEVPHIVHGRKIGTIAALAVLRRSPQGAAYRGQLVFPLCRGTYVHAIFAALKPLSDSTGLGDQFTINGTLASTWNEQHLRLALAGVSLDGYLRAGRVTARASGRLVTGVLTDCAGHPVPGVTVHAGAARAKTDAAGRYKLRLSRPGNYRVVATTGAATVSASIRVR